MIIGELSSQAGVPASTIRYWERIKILPKPQRVSGKRRYSPDALNHLAVLRLAQSCGFTLDEMRQLFYGFRSGVTASERWQVLASKKKHVLDEGSVAPSEERPDNRWMRKRQQGPNPLFCKRWFPDGV